MTADPLCEWCDLTPNACRKSRVKCCPDCTHLRAIPTAATLLDGLAATRAADEKAREKRLPWSAS